MQEPSLFIGVDVSKAELVIATGDQRRVHCIANDAASISNWLAQIPAYALIAMESTGSYHGLLA
ncbi:IS110 family transposase, partial [Hydrogenophaga intermedia]|nr:IS110 family transposase [Hydrogenophaga intermedia]